MLNILNLISPLIIWFIERFIVNKTRKEEAKKKYLSYIEYWEKNREDASAISDDVDELIKRSEDENR